MREYQCKTTGSQVYRRWRKEKNVRPTKSECCMERTTLFASAEFFGWQARLINF